MWLRVSKQRATLSPLSRAVEPFRWGCRSLRPSGAELSTLGTLKSQHALAIRYHGKNSPQARIAPLLEELEELKEGGRNARASGQANRQTCEPSPTPGNAPPPPTNLNGQQPDGGRSAAPRAAE